MTFAASATTSKSPIVRSSMINPERTTWWSSTTMTLIKLSTLLLRFSKQTSFESLYHRGRLS